MTERVRLEVRLTDILVLAAIGGLVYLIWRYGPAALDKIKRILSAPIEAIERIGEIIVEPGPAAVRDLDVERMTPQQISESGLAVALTPAGVTRAEEMCSELGGYLVTEESGIPAGASILFQVIDMSRAMYFDPATGEPVFGSLYCVKRAELTYGGRLI